MIDMILFALFSVLQVTIIKMKIENVFVGIVVCMCLDIFKFTPFKFSVEHLYTVPVLDAPVKRNQRFK